MSERKKTKSVQGISLSSLFLNKEVIQGEHFRSCFQSPTPTMGIDFSVFPSSHC